MSLNIPESVFHEPMTLVPISHVNDWLRDIETSTNDPDYMLHLAVPIDIGRRGVLSRWFFSGHDLAATIRRINTSISCFQSGVFLGGAVSGPYMKWVYDNKAVAPDVKVHDGIRCAIFLTKVLRRYLGEQFNPTLVRLPGKRTNTSAYNQFFGCEVEWNQPSTEVWFHSKLRMTTALYGRQEKKQLAMSYGELDDILNMPSPEDELKVVYETINYSRHLGMPKVAIVAEMLGLSVQQFQRRLRTQNLDFTTLMSYVLSNTAVNLFAKGLGIETVAQQLGYTNTASFTRMFKKNRGVTPSQYIEMFHDSF
ncbi:AraC family transcriptional regulator ligand-binding domain-containing protein [Vibrio hannami]|nr:AraC family transcriptional regulator ligand-binding domain-containing protein [Vibrio hannami]MDG3085929.1 AraC family transcriptional regulator ligand-binding domain-containing protein [Vibrio hannami]